MAQSIGVQEVQNSGRAGVSFGLLVALMAASALFVGAVVRASTTPTVLTAPNPRLQTVQSSNGWQAGAENAGFTGRLGAVTPQVVPYSYGSWVTSAEAAGFTGRLGGVTAQTGSETFGEWRVGDGKALAAAKIAGLTGRLGGAAAPASSSTQDAKGVNVLDKLKAGRA